MHEVYAKRRCRTRSSEHSTKNALSGSGNVNAQGVSDHLYDFTP